MPFRYLRDRLFLACVAVYFLNRFVFKRVWNEGFLHDHLNDLICIPFWVPIMLWGERRVGLRRHDGPPDAVEIIIPLLIWAWTFEVFLPEASWFGRRFVSDHRDLLAYSAGAFGASLYWRWAYRGDLGDLAVDPGPVE